MNGPTPGQRRVRLLNHPALDPSLAAAYTRLARAGLADPGAGPDAALQAAWDARHQQWQARIGVIQRRLRAADDGEFGLGLAVTLLFPFSFSVLLTILVSGLLPFIPPRPYFLAQYLLWQLGTAVLAWAWASRGRSARRKLRAGLPPAPAPAERPQRQVTAPATRFWDAVTVPADRWRNFIRQHPTSWPVTNGQPGELEALGAVLGLDRQPGSAEELWLVLHGLQIGPRADLDLLVLTPWGLRALEVKYWQGEIRYFGGRWEHTNHFYGPGGTPETEVKWPRDPLQQVRHQLQVLRRSLPRGTHLQGALVFSHPNAWLVHDPFPPDLAVLAVAGVRDWLLADADRPPVYSPQQLVALAGRLLQRAARFAPPPAPAAGPLDDRLGLAVAEWQADDRRFCQAAEAYLQATPAQLEAYVRAAQAFARPHSGGRP